MRTNMYPTNNYSTILDTASKPSDYQFTWLLKWASTLAIATGVILGFIFVIGHLIKPSPFTQDAKQTRTSLEMVHVVPAPTSIQQAPAPMTTPAPEAPPEIETETIEIPTTNITPQLHTPKASTLPTVSPTFAPILSTHFDLPDSAVQNVAPTSLIPPTVAPSTTGPSTQAHPLVRLNPTYPARALRRGVEGFVKVEIHINTDGSVKSARVVESQPPRIFDRSALRAVRQWQFRPTVRDGKAVEQISLQTIDFRLDK